MKKKRKRAQEGLTSNAADPTKYPPLPNAHVQGTTSMNTSQRGLGKPKQTFSEDTTVSYDDGTSTRMQSNETTRGRRVRGRSTFSSTDAQGNVTTQLDRWNQRGKKKPKIIYPK